MARQNKTNIKNERRRDVWTGSRSREQTEIDPVRIWKKARVSFWVVASKNESIIGWEWQESNWKTNWAGKWERWADSENLGSQQSYRS